jgi:hypothetical protein
MKKLLSIKSHKDVTIHRLRSQGEKHPSKDPLMWTFSVSYEQ